MADPFDNLFKEKLYAWEEPCPPGAWENFRRRAAARQRWVILRRVGSVAACLALGLGLFLGLKTRLPAPQQTAALPPVTLAAPPARTLAPDPAISTLYAHLLRTPGHLLEHALRHAQDQAPVFRIPAIDTAATPTPEPVQDPALSQAIAALPQPLRMRGNLNPYSVFGPQDKAREAENRYLQEERKRIRTLYKQWVASVNFSYQSAIEGNYPFSPTAYTQDPWASDTPEIGEPTPETQFLSGLLSHHYEREFLPEALRSSARYAVPFTVGVNLQKEFNKYLSVGLSCTYSLLRSTYQAEYQEETYEVRQRTHYIGIPLSVYFHALNTPKMNLYVMGGGCMEQAVANQYVFQRGPEASPHNMDIHQIQWSAFGGVGIEYKCTSFMGVYVEPSAVHFFDNNQPHSIRTLQPTQFKVELGVRFRI